MYKNLFVLFFILFLFNRCDNNTERITIPNAEEEKELVAIGSDISGKLLKTLKTELQAAMKEGGVNSAIEVCNLKALPLTEIIKNSGDKIISVKRTTNKFRNKQNEPNEFEKLALAHYNSLIESRSEIPEYYTQKINEKDSSYFYFYKPLFVGSLCLTCHGSDQFVAQEVRSQLSELYPEDKALNYSEGDFRGLVSVRIQE